LKSSRDRGDFEEEQKIDKVLMVLFFLVSAVLGYGLTHLLPL
jgi:hypothetical protein